MSGLLLIASLGSIAWAVIYARGTHSHAMPPGKAKALRDRHIAEMESELGLACEALDYR